MICDIRHFLDALTCTALPAVDRPVIAGRIAPSLVRSARDLDLAPMVSHSLDSLVEIKAIDPERAFLSQLSNPVLHPEAGRQDTAIVMLMQDGRPIASASLRLRWIEGNLQDAIETKTLFYADPTQAPEAELIVCRASKAREIRACHVIVAGALWVAKTSTSVDSRVIKLLVRFLNLLATANYHWSWCISFSLPPLMRQAFPIYGADGVEHGVYMDIGNRRVETVLVHASRARFLDNLLSPGYLDLANDLDALTDQDLARATRAAAELRLRRLHLGAMH